MSAFTELACEIVKRQLCVSCPPLLHAPDQIAVRPSPGVRTIDVPEANEAEPLDPESTFRPAGLEVIDTPLRPVTFSASENEPDGGGGGALPPH